METKFKIPESLKLEHAELHSELARLTNEEGKIGEAARVVAQTLHPHFVSEEEFALPPLGVLPLLVEGKVTADMKEVLIMTDKLKAGLSKMLEEHKSIVVSLDNLMEVARNENPAQVVEFAVKLKLHAKTEEEVTYPTALLIGEYLKLKLN